MRFSVRLVINTTYSAYSQVLKFRIVTKHKNNISTSPSTAPSPDISYVDWFLAKSEDFEKCGSPKTVGGQAQEQNRQAMPPSVLFRAFFTTPLLLRNFSGSPSSPRWFLGLITPQGQAHQPPMTPPKQLLHRIGATQLHRHSPHAHSHLRRHFQQLQAHAAHRGLR